MKIVHLCLCGPYNDNWGYQDNMIPKYNKKDGHDVTVITSIFTDSTQVVGYEKVKPGQYYLDDGVKIVRIPFKKLFLEKIVEKLRIYEGLHSILEEEKPDIIFIHGIQFIDLLKVLKYKKRNPKCRLIADNHASYENSAKNFLSREILHKIIFKSTIQKSINYIEKVYAITPACRKFASEMYGIPPNKFDYLFLGFDTDKVDFKNKESIRRKIRKKINIEFDDKVLITGGKLSEGKKIDFLLKSFSKISSSKVKLIIFGEFSNDIKEDMLTLIEKDKRVIYLGWKNAEDIYDLYFAADLAVFLGTQSALWQQAIGTGLPIMVKKWDGIEYLDLGGNCIFVEEDEEDKVSKMIEDIILDDNKLKIMREISETLGYETFSYKSISRRAIK